MFRLAKARRSRCAQSLCRALVLGLLLVSPAEARQGVLVIGNDRGGSVEQRVAAVRALQGDGTRVEIRGDYCMSACTMYLALSDLCVAPRTVFGFHGPGSSIYGIGLTPAAFEHWSQVMARHYPEPIRSWYLNVARNRTIGFYSVQGHDLIEIGGRSLFRQLNGRDGLAA